jgi:uncharacterized protein (DUF2267 family)
VRPARAEAVTFVVFQELRDRLPPKEAADVGAQLPTGLRRLWRAADRPGWPVQNIHGHEFVEWVRQFAVLHDDREAERAVRAVFGAQPKAHQVKVESGEEYH